MCLSFSIGGRAGGAWKDKVCTDAVIERLNVASEEEGNDKVFRLRTC